MSGSTLTDVFEALMGALEADSTIAAAVGTAIYAAHRPPNAEDAPLPAIYVGLVSDTRSERGMTWLRIQIDTYVADGDLATAWEISDAIAGILHGGGLSILGWACYHITRDANRNNGTDADGVASVSDDYTLALARDARAAVQAPGGGLIKL